MNQIFRKQLPLIIQNARGKRHIITKRAKDKFAALLELAQRRIHVRIRGSADLHHAPEQPLRIDVRDLWLFAAVDRLPTTRALLLGELLEVLGPYFGLGELGLEGDEPVVV